MNIHFTDLNDFEKLKDNTFCTLEFGSRIHGTYTEKSDYDIICLVCSPDKYMFDPIRNTHNLQFKDSYYDYIFIDIVTFFKNMLSGDSVVNFEALVANDFDLMGLDQWKHEFITYNLIKGYLGMVKRDLKYNSIKRINHAERGIIMAERLLNGIIDVKFTPSETNKEVLYDKYITLRAQLVDMFQEGNIKSFPSRECMDYITNTAYTYHSSRSSDVADVFRKYNYDVMQNGLKYE